MPSVQVTFLGHFKGLWSKGGSLWLSLPGLEQSLLPPEAADLGTRRSPAAELSSRSPTLGNSVCVNLQPPLKRASLCKTVLNLKESRKRRDPPALLCTTLIQQPEGGTRKENSHRQLRRSGDKCPLGMLQASDSSTKEK